jgi:hypothetical protein
VFISGLELPNKSNRSNNVEDLMTLFTKEEQLDSYCCDTCKTNGQIVPDQAAPQVLFELVSIVFRAV